jgi:hypothetical protein
LATKASGRSSISRKIVIPSRKVQLAIEHRHAVAHIVEGHAQLGLALTDFLQ